MLKVVERFTILQNKFVIALIGCACVICLSFFTCMLGKKGSENVQYYCVTEMGDQDTKLGELKSGEAIIQPLNVPYPILKGIYICFVSNIPGWDGLEGIEGYEVIAQLLLDGVTVQEWSMEPDDVLSEKGIFLDRPLMVDSREVALRIVIYSEQEETPITIRSTARIENNEFSCKIGNTDTMRTLNLQVRGSYGMHTVRLFIFCLLIYTLMFFMLYNAIFNPVFEKKNTLDKVIIGGVLMSCTFFFAHYNDMKIITELSYQLLRAVQEGKLLRFYEYALENSRYPGNANYNILLYMVTAVIDLPVLICRKLGFDISKGVEILYINAVLCVVFYFVGKLLKKMLVLWKLEAVDAEIVETFYYLNAILLFASVGYGQLDITCAAILLLALYFYSKDKMDLFAMILSVSIAMKSFPILILIPLILLREKRIFHILRYTMEGMLAPALFHLLYGGSDAWKEIQSQYNFLNHLFSQKLTLQISMFCMLYIIVCIVCYFHDSMETYKNILWSGIATYAVFAVFTVWFPHYLTIFAIFLGMGVLLFEDKNKFMSVMFLATVGYLGYSTWHYYYDENFMFYHGIMLLGTKYDISEMTVGRFVEMHLSFGQMEVLMFSVFAAAVVFITGKSICSIEKQEKGEKIKSLPLYRGYLYLQALPLYLFIIVSVVMVLSF